MRPTAACLRPVSLLLTLSLASAAAACGKQPAAAGETPPKRVTDDPNARPGPAESMTVSAAGIELQLPVTWELHDSPNPNFAMALAPAAEGTQLFSCVIELRRQGRGELSRAAKLTKTSTPSDLRYNQGPLHGRLREFPGPDPSAKVIVHCRGPRASSDWGLVDVALDALEPSAPASLAAKLDAPKPESIVELCTGSPARKTHACARRQDGKVYCGASGGAELLAVADLPPSLQLGCDGARSCSLDAEGQVSCWKAGQPVKAASELGKVSDLAGGCAVREDASVWCRARREDGLSLENFAELKPLDDASLALSEVSQVLAGTNANHGCVVSKGELRCWDKLGEYGFAAEGIDSAPQRIAEVGEVEDLVRVDGRVCTVAGERWTCYGGEEPVELAPCSVHACACSLVATSVLSCEHEPHARLDSQTFGFVDQVVATEGACAALADGRVVCRGPATGKRGDSEEVQALVTGKVPGILHVLQLSEG